MIKVKPITKNILILSAAILTITTIYPGVSEGSDSCNWDTSACDAGNIGYCIYWKRPWLIYQNDPTRMRIYFEVHTGVNNDDDHRTIELSPSGPNNYIHCDKITVDGGYDSMLCYTNVSNLTPGVKYTYTVKARRYTEEDWRCFKGDFYAAPTEYTDSLEFYGFGDNKYISDDDPSYNSISNIVDKINNHSGNKTFIIGTGDYVYLGGDDRGFGAGRWDKFFSIEHMPYFLGQWPMFTALGNHDFQTDCGSYSCGNAGIYYRYFPYPKAGDGLKDAYYWFHYGLAHFWSIDTWPMNGATYCGACDNMKNTSAQYRWFEQTLQSIENDHRQWKIVFLHAPFYDADRSCNLQDGRDYFQPLFEKYGVDIVLAGHEHYYANKVVNGIPYQILGGGGAGLSAMDYPEDVDVAVQTHHFAYFKITGDLMEVQVIDDNNNVIDDFYVDRIPRANFDAEPAVGSSYTYQFTDKSTGHRYQYIWEFGDGDTSTERNPIHIYTTSGFYTIKLTIRSDFNSDSHTDTIYLTELNTTTTITSDSPDPSLVGQSITVNWQVTADPGSGTPTGTVTVLGGGGSCSAPVEAGTCDLNPTQSGDHDLFACYSGDGKFNASCGSELHTVNKADTTITVNSDAPDPSVVGQPFTVTWTVTVTPPGSGIPTGYVNAWGEGGSCTAPVERGACDLTLTMAGFSGFGITYLGDLNFNPSNGSASHEVNKADTTTVITSDNPDPSVANQPYTVTWTVTPPGSGTPTGYVYVYDGIDDFYGSCGAPVATGTCNLTSPTAGTKTLLATYQGDNNFNSSSGTTQHTVNKADTTTTLSSSPNPSVYGHSVTFTATVTANPPGSGTPTGIVTFKEGTTVLGSNTLNASRQATFNTSTLSVGPHTITTEYAGDANFNSSSGSTSHSSAHSVPALPNWWVTAVSLLLLGAGYGLSKRLKSREKRGPGT